jgi:hypothetical protein
MQPKMDDAGLNLGHEPVQIDFLAPSHSRDVPQERNDSPPMRRPGFESRRRSEHETSLAELGDAESFGEGTGER